MADIYDRPEREPDEGEYDRFAQLTRNLLRVPKADVDEKRRKPESKPVAGNA